MHFAAESGHVEVARLLLEAGASPTTRAIDGLAPLDIASQYGCEDVVHILQNAADVATQGRDVPWGSSRTRWEMEASGRLTLEGCIETAWMVSYIKHFRRVP